MKPWVARVLAAAIIAAAGAWLVFNTRWVEGREPIGATGAAARDRHYSLRPIVVAAGSSLHVRASLEPLPPAGAVLLLQSTSWDLLPGASSRLQAWVEHGGHLVLGGVSPGDERMRWLPIGLATHARKTSMQVPADGGAGPASAAGTQDKDKDTDTDTDDDDCPTLTETPDFASGLDRRPRSYETCEIRPRGTMRSLSGPPLWHLVAADDDGPGRDAALRVALGRGDVTLGPARLPLGNQALLHGDTAVAVCAILGLRPGRALWIVEDEAREPLLPWLWRTARAPLLLGLAAVALALWRAGRRFGPLAAPLATPRRSVGEQVRRMGEFLASRDPAALHDATRRALDESAHRRIEGWRAMTATQRIDALARRVSLDRAALDGAWNLMPGDAPRKALPAIDMLERARRALCRPAGKSG